MLEKYFEESALLKDWRGAPQDELPTDTDIEQVPGTLCSIITTTGYLIIVV